MRRCRADDGIEHDDRLDIATPVRFGFGDGVYELDGLDFNDVVVKMYVREFAVGVYQQVRGLEAVHV